jgi:hypothetical protein
MSCQIIPVGQVLYKISAEVINVPTVSADYAGTDPNIPIYKQHTLSIDR